MKVLVTAGATWIKVDEVRILTSIFTGSTGLLIAQVLKKKGFRVTLVVNTHCAGDIKGFRVIPFRYFDDFKHRIKDELTRTHYDAIIHSAAVSDYRLSKVYNGKIPSGKTRHILSLKPTEKIVKFMRRLARKTLLIQFKLEIKRAGLINEAILSLKDNKSDFVVANALEDLKASYRAFILDKSKNVIEVSSRSQLAHTLCKIVSSYSR